MVLRVARHTDDLKKIEDFYINILGFELLGSFEKHNNYNGVFIGKSGLDWHLNLHNLKQKRIIRLMKMILLYFILRQLESTICC